MPPKVRSRLSHGTFPMIASSSARTASSEHSSFRLIVSAGVVGVLAGLSAAAFHFGVDKGYAFVRSLASGEYGFMLSGWVAATLLAGRLVALAAFLVRRFTPEAVGSGINEVEGVIHDIRPPLRWRRVIPVKFVGGLAAMTSGLVVGREGPTVHIGAAFGTMIGRIGRASVPEANVLVSAGAGAGLAAAFNAPSPASYSSARSWIRAFSEASPPCIPRRLLRSLRLRSAARSSGKVPSSSWAHSPFPRHPSSYG
jgi:H+/Cl- antiporter ClcA